MMQRVGYKKQILSNQYKTSKGVRRCISMCTYIQSYFSEVIFFTLPIMVTLTKNIGTLTILYFCFLCAIISSDLALSKVPLRIIIITVV